MVGAFTKPSSGRRSKPIHSISKQYSIQTLERVYKYYYYIIRGEIISTGVKITNLIDELGMAKPFLALSTENKIQERVMSVIIPQELKSKNAFFEVYPSNDYKKCIKRQPLTYDSNIGGYKRAISFPRQGWIYAIVWEWEENN